MVQLKPIYFKFSDGGIIDNHKIFLIDLILIKRLKSSRIQKEKKSFLNFL